MDIPAISMGLANQTTTTSVELSMLKRSMDQMALQGAEMAQMIESAAVPKTGKIDISL